MHREVGSSRWINFFLPMLTIGLLSSCDSNREPEQLFTHESPECEEQSLKGRYLVRWNSGRVSLVKSKNKKELIDSFVRPHMNDIYAIEPDKEIHIDPPVKSDQIFPHSLSSKVDNWGQVLISASSAWKAGIYGQGVKVAVIDSGIQVDHPWLETQVDLNKGESGYDDEGNPRETNGIDDDENGFVDDNWGYNFATNSPDVRDTTSHGTHVSGIIAAHHKDDEAGEKEYTQGVAPAAKIIPLVFIDSEGSGTLFDAIQAMNYAAKRGAKVINASWGGAPCSGALEETINKLAGKGIMFVAAAGNSGTNIDENPEYPASHRHYGQLTIGSIAHLGGMARHSNFGDDSVDLFAPGVDIISSIPSNQAMPATGTSMATPFVAGAVALLLSDRPNAKIQQIKKALLSGSTNNKEYRNVSHGRLNICRALKELRQILPEKDSPASEFKCNDDER